MNETLQAAVNHLYESRFDAGRQVLNNYAQSNPQDPLPYAMKAASYLFGELERRGELRGDLLSEPPKAEARANYQPDSTSKAALDQAANLARQYAADRLRASPDDRNALLAMCIVAGVQRDYLAMVEHKMRESYPFIRESNDYAKRLLKADPTAYDAYLTKGFTEYLVASLPFYLRWIMSRDDVTGTREQGLSDLRIAASSGQYLKPFAQLLLAMFYLREKREDQTQELLSQLMEQYPSNKIFRAEFDKLRKKRESARKLR